MPPQGTYVRYEDRAEADGSVLYGLDRELAEKAKLKFDPKMETDARQWIEAVLDEQLGEDLQQALKDGVVLCRLLNTIKPGSCPKPSTSAMPFKQMENISKYLEGCAALGVPSNDSFQTVALYENKDWMAVLTNIHSLGRVAQKVEGFSGPALGPKLASTNQRHFTEEQLRQSAAAPTLIGKGSHGHATQAGMIDKSKNIVKGDVAGLEGLGRSEVGTRLNQGSAGLASQSGTVDTNRSIVRSGAVSTAHTLEDKTAQEDTSTTSVTATSEALPDSAPSAVPTPSDTRTSAGSKTSGATYVRYEDRADADGTVLYGLDRELAEKAKNKFDPQMETDARQWIEAVLDEQLGEDLQQALKDGVVLCRLLNTIKPGSCPKPSTSAMPFKQMENISKYLEGCTALGIPSNDSFQTVALYENKDWMAVLTNIHSLGRVAQKVEGFSGPALGPKLASTNQRHFTDEQLRQSAAAPTFIGKGSHGHATQAGMIDKSKNIVKGDVAGLEGLGRSEVGTRLNQGSAGLASQSGTVDTNRNIVRPIG